MSLKAPFPYFGGKSRVADVVWQAFGNVRNYIEPFCGSAAMLLGRPETGAIETVNDANCFIANFWRAMAADPEAVARYADYPVNEADLHARHRWLMLSESSHDWREKMKTDPDHYDAKVAGWWVWGASCWIGSGWCDGGRLFALDGVSSSNQRPSIAKPCALASLSQQLPSVSGDRGGGQGVHRKRPMVCGTHGGIAVHADANAGLYDWFGALAQRLRRVRVCCGDWKRVCTPAVLASSGICGVFLDPPYADTAGRDSNIYAVDSLTVAHAVREWAIANGDDPKLRIALCGYEGEHQMPGTWRVHAWKTGGGYGNQSKGRGKENAHKERIWFSPHCIVPEEEPQTRLFEVAA